MSDELQIIVWPDPRLLKLSKVVKDFGPQLTALAQRMFELMREARGVGLAAPQVGQNLRLFVMNHTGKPEDDRVYVNPVLSDAEGAEDGDEGCLSLPDITATVNRSTRVRMRAQNLSGQTIEEIGEGYIARIWQHEYDHLNGTLLLDRMGPAAQLGVRKTLRDLQAKWDKQAVASPKSR
jgi:peptide deformylase